MSTLKGGGMRTQDEIDKDLDELELDMEELKRIHAEAWRLIAQLEESTTC